MESTEFKMPGVGPVTLQKLVDAGLTDVKRLARAKLDDLLEIEGMGEKTALKIISYAQEQTGIGGPCNAMDDLDDFNKNARFISTNSKSLDSLLGGGIRCGFTWEIAGVNGHGKCIPAGSQVNMADGTMKNVEEVMVGDRVMSYDPGTMLLVPSTVTATMDSGVKPLLDIELEAGKTLMSSPDHRVLTFDGWKKASELSYGDFVANAKTIQTSDYSDIGEDEAILLATWISEGNKWDNTFSFTMDESDSNIKLIQEAANNLGFTVTRRKGTGPFGKWAVKSKDRSPTGGPRSLLYINGLRGSHTNSVRLPPRIMSAEPSVLKTFLRVLFDCDGDFARAARAVCYTSISERLVRDLHIALLRLGIQSNISNKVGKYDGKECQLAWRLSIGQSDSVRRFCTEVGTNNKVSYMDKLLSELGQTAWSPWNTIPSTWFDNQVFEGGMVRKYIHGSLKTTTRTTIVKAMELAKNTGNKSLASLCQSDVAWLQVTGVMEGSPTKMYDLEVADTNNFLVDGVVVHNSQLAMQIAANSIIPKEAGGTGGKCIWIDTENTGRLAMKRIHQIVTALNLPADDIIRENLRLVKCENTEMQVNAVNRLLDNDVKYDCVVVDGIMTKFRVEYSGRGTLADRSDQLKPHLDALNNYAMRNDAAVIYTNQVSDSPEMYSGGPRAIGGNIVGHSAKYRLFIRMAEKGAARIVRLDKSADLPQGEAIIAITSDGITDYKKAGA